ncbi:MAG: hypothetical protein ABL999_05345 [Pyrinomonadaceae bacterium]
MEKIDYAKETERALVMSQFYYSMSLLQHKAIKYVAHGETQAGKYARVKEIIGLVTKAGAQIVDGDAVPHEHCEPPCWTDEATGMCNCPVGFHVDLHGGVVNP